MITGAIVLSMILGAATTPPISQTTIGAEGRVLFSYRGGPIHPRAELGPDLTMRIADQVSDGDAGTLYDIRFIARRPGVLDIVQFLEHADGTPLNNAPALPVLVRSVLPIDSSSDLSGDARATLPFVGGYRGLLILAGALFVIPPLVALVRRLRRPRPVKIIQPADPTQIGILRMRELIDEMIRGDIPEIKQAELERLIIDHWRTELAPDGERALDDLLTIRSNEHAGDLIAALEAVLHQRQAREEDWTRARVALDDFLARAQAPAQPAGAGA